MLRHLKYRPYIRRANGRETSSNLAVALALAEYEIIKRPFYVLVQRGLPQVALLTGPNRQNLLKRLCRAQKIGFKAWARNIQREASSR